MTLPSTGDEAAGEDRLAVIARLASLDYREQETAEQVLLGIEAAPAADASGGSEAAQGSASSVNGNSDIAALLAEAVGLWNAGAREMGLERVQQLTRSVPQAADPWAFCASMLMEVGGQQSLEQAEVAARTALALRNTPDYHLTYGRVLAALGQSARALPHVDAYLAADPADVAALKLRTELLMATGRVDAALELAVYLADRAKMVDFLGLMYVRASQACTTQTDTSHVITSEYQARRVADLMARASRLPLTSSEIRGLVAEWAGLAAQALKRHNPDLLRGGDWKAKAFNSAAGWTVGWRLNAQVAEESGRVIRWGD